MGELISGIKIHFPTNRVANVNALYLYTKPNNTPLHMLRIHFYLLFNTVVILNPFFYLPNLPSYVT